MARKSTGRPVGRPVGTRTAVVELETASFKAPVDLLGRVRQYAKQHRQSLSELIRDGLEWRIGEGDPRGLGVSLPGGDSETGWQEVLEAAAVIQTEQVLQEVREVRAVLARQGEQIQALVQALGTYPAMTAPSREPLRDSGKVPGRPGMERGSKVAENNGVTGNTAKEAEGQAGEAEVQGDRAGVGQGFDPAKHRLGVLCPRGHDWQGTGQSRRTKSQAGYCLACNAEGKQRERAGKKQTSIKI